MAQVLTLEALKVLDMIDKKGSFAAAANAMHKVPSALSYTVQKLEADLKVSIFDRSRQRAEFTSCGRFLLEQGRLILQAAHSLEEAVHQLEAGWEVTLRIAKDTVLPMSPMVSALRAFQLLDKQVTVDISEEVLGGTWDALLHERCDLAVGASGELPRGVFEFIHIGDVEFVFAVSGGHPLILHNGPVDAAAIRAFPTVVVGDSSMTEPMRSTGILESRQTIRVANSDAKIQMQKAGLGVGFLPKHLVEKELRSGELVALPCTIPRPQAPMFMAWRKGNNGRALAWFVEALAKVDWFAA